MRQRRARRRGSPSRAGSIGDILARCVLHVVPCALLFYAGASSGEAPDVPRPVQTPATLTVSYHRFWQPDRKPPEESDGTIYYRATGTILVHALKPIEQILEMQGEHLRVFYPGSKDAFDLLTEENQGLPFFSIFLGSLDEDFGLSKTGYTIRGHEMRQDTLVTSWDGPSKAGKSLGSAILARHGERVARLDLLDPKGRLMIRYRCSGNLESSGYAFPSEIETVSHRGPAKGVERISYSALAVNDALPAWVLQFQLPANVTVRDLR